MQHSKPSTKSKKAKLTGFVAVEFLIYATLTIVVATVFAKILSTVTGQQINKRNADYQREVATAAREYVKRNFATLLATPSTTAITVATLRSANLLPAGFSNTLPTGQTPCVLVARTSLTELQAMVTTEGASLGEGNLAQIAAQLDAEGGYVDPAITSSFRAKSTTDTFNIDLAPYRTTSCSGTAVAQGGLASRLFFADTTYPPPFLRTDPDPTSPSGSLMSTTLNMGGNPITNVSNLTATGNVTAPCFVPPSDPSKFVCPAANSVIKNLFITDRSTTLPIKDMIGNMLERLPVEIDMSTAPAGAQFVSFPTGAEACPTGATPRIYPSIVKTQMTIQGTTTTYHVDKSTVAGGWVVGIYDTASTAQTFGKVVARILCDITGL